MAKKNTKAQLTLIGLFVLSSLLVGVLMLLAFGNSKWNKDTISYRLYYTSSVKGLSVGSPVMFRGVKIGQVTGVRLCQTSLTEYRLPLHGNATKEELASHKLIPGDSLPVEVDLTIVPMQMGIEQHWSEKFIPFANDNKAQARAMISRAVLQHKLSAKIKQLSLLTGQLYIELSFGSSLNIPRDYLITAIADNVIPTELSVMERVNQQLAKHGADSHVEAFKTLLNEASEFVLSGKSKNFLDNLSRIATNIESTSRNVDEQLPVLAKQLQWQLDQMSNQIKTLVSKAGGTLEQSTKFIGTLDKVVAQNDLQLKKTLDSAQKALEQSRILMENLIQTTAPDSQLQQQISQALQECQETTQSLQNLIDLLARDPQAIIRGR